MSTFSYVLPFPAHQSSPLADFRNYLEQSLRNPFTIDLKDCSLMEVIRICAKTKSRLHPHYRASLNCLIYNLELLEREFHITLQPIQITDIFWSYFISFCQGKGLKPSTITTLCCQLRSILNWATKYNAIVAPTYGDFDAPKGNNQEIALTADEVSRIAYFDIDRFYTKKRKDYRETMHRVRDMFVLACNLGQRHSDMVRISASCFERNMFRIVQQKTGNIAVVNIDKYAIEPKTTYRILEKYNYEAPYKATIGNYNYHLHHLLRDIGFTDVVRMEDRVNGILQVSEVPKWKCLTSHSGRRTFITINVLRGKNLHELKKASGHCDLRHLDGYIRDE